MASVFQKIVFINRTVCGSKLKTLCLESSNGTCMTPYASTRRFLSLNISEAEKSSLVKNDGTSKENTKDEPHIGLAATLNKASKVSNPMSNFDKTILVWAGRYKSKADIPEKVDVDTLNRARDKMRVVGSLWIMAAAIVGSIMTVKIGQYHLNKHHADAEEEVIKRQHERMQQQQQQQNLAK